MLTTKAVVTSRSSLLRFYYISSRLRLNDPSMEPAVAAIAYELVHDALLSPHDRIKNLLASLPVLGKDAVDLEEPCPICLMPFSSVLADEADAGLNSTESNKDADEKEKDKEEALGGVTKLVGCGHIFCRRE